MTARKRAGRRGGDTDSRATIVTAARELFAAQGYDGTSVRQIAARAEVDPALIRHFFTDKQTLFTVTLTDGAGLAQRIVSVVTSGSDDVGRRIAETYLGMWEDADTRLTLITLVRSAMTSDHAIGMLRGAIGATIQDAAHEQGRDIDQFGIALAMSHLLGLAVGRHMLRFPPLAEIELEALVDEVAPTIQRYLDRRGESPTSSP